MIHKRKPSTHSLLLILVLFLPITTFAQMLTFKPLPPTPTPTYAPGERRWALLPECAHQCTNLYSAQYDCRPKDPTAPLKNENWQCFCEHPALATIMSLNSQGMGAGECDAVCSSWQEREDIANFVWDQCFDFDQQKKDAAKLQRIKDELDKKRAEREEEERKAANRASLDAKNRESENSLRPQDDGKDAWIDKAWPFLLLTLLLILLPILLFSLYRFLRPRFQHGVFTPLPMYQDQNGHGNNGNVSLTRRLTNIFTHNPATNYNYVGTGTISERAPVLPSLSVLRREREERERLSMSADHEPDGRAPGTGDSGSPLVDSHHNVAVGFYQPGLKKKVSDVSSLTTATSSDTLRAGQINTSVAPSIVSPMSTPLASIRSRQQPMPRSFSNLTTTTASGFGSQRQGYAASDVSEIDIAEQSIADMASPGPISPLRVVNTDSELYGIPEIELVNEGREVQAGGLAGLAGIVAKRWSDHAMDVDSNGNLRPLENTSSDESLRPLTPIQTHLEAPEKTITRQWSWEADAEESSFSGISPRRSNSAFNSSSQSFNPPPLTPLQTNRSESRPLQIKPFPPTLISRTPTASTTASTLSQNPLSPILLSSPLLYNNPARTSTLPPPIQTSSFDSPTLPHLHPIGTPRVSSEGRTSWLHSPPSSNSSSPIKSENEGMKTPTGGYYYAGGQVNEDLEEEDSGEETVDAAMARYREEQERELEGMLGVPRGSIGFSSGRQGRLGTVREEEEGRYF